MKIRLASILVAALLSAMIVGCAEAPILSLGNDTFTVSQTSAGGIFKSLSSLRDEVIGRVNDMAASKGKVAVFVSEEGSPAWPGHNPSFTYTFRLVTSAVAASEAGIATASAQKSSSVHERLVKLDDLRVKGILTQAEFDAQKVKILAE
jgi:hypothetical protein